jgi:hypothetical protein
LIVVCAPTIAVAAVVFVATVAAPSSSTAPTALLPPLTPQCRQTAAAAAMLHTNGVVMSHLFPAMDIGGTALSVAAAIFLSAVVPQVETKTAPTTTAVATTNEMRHGAPSTLPSNPCLREGKSKGNEGKDGGHRCGRQW